MGKQFGSPDAEEQIRGLVPRLVIRSTVILVYLSYRWPFHKVLPRYLAIIVLHTVK